MRQPHYSIDRLSLNRGAANRGRRQPYTAVPRPNAHSRVTRSSWKEPKFVLKSNQIGIKVTKPILNPLLFYYSILNITFFAKNYFGQGNQTHWIC